MSKEKKEKNYFEELNSINVSDKIEKKNGLPYLSWAFAWSEIKKRYPNVKKNVVKNEQGWLYHTDGKTCWVEVSVVINDIEEVEYLPVMDYKNQAIPLERVTSMNVNTTIQRALTKAIARHGLGLYIYAGEDLSQEEKEWQDKEMEELVREKKEAHEKKKAKAENKSKEIQQSMLDCGSVAEIDKILEEEKVAMDYLENNFKAIFNAIIKCKEAMIKQLDPEGEEVNLMQA